MNLDMVRKSRWMMMSVLVGSRAYGTETPESDTDIRGVFSLPLENRLTLKKLPEEVSAEDGDEKYYELFKMMDLLSGCNPNIIEMLYVPDSCILECDSRGRLLIENRDMFLTKKALHTFSGYAHAQIKKARGQNKRVHNPCPEERPSREDYCWVIYPSSGSVMPSRPVSLKDSGLDLSVLSCSRVEHSHNMYRLYDTGHGKGVFRGDNLVVESISKEEELLAYVGQLIFNVDAYEKGVREWKQYWEWVAKRNDSRWESQESGEMDYDCKNIMHCVRLMIAGQSIFEENTVKVRFKGDELKYLRDIRAGKFAYEFLMEDVEERMTSMRELADKSDLPRGVNAKKVDELFKEIARMS